MPVGTLEFLESAEEKIAERLGSQYGGSCRAKRRGGRGKGPAEGRPGLRG